MLVDGSSIFEGRERSRYGHATAIEEWGLTTLWMVRGILYIFGGVFCLGAWVWNGEPTYIVGTVFGLGFGIWNVWSSVSTSKEDEERERTAPSRIESATAGLESVWSQRTNADRSEDEPRFL